MGKAAQNSVSRMLSRETVFPNDSQKNEKKKKNKTKKTSQHYNFWTWGIKKKIKNKRAFFKKNLVLTLRQSRERHRKPKLINQLIAST